MEIPAFLRNPAFLLTAVAALIAVIWFMLGRPVVLPPTPLGSNEKLDCISYSPFRGTETPVSGAKIAPERIDADFAKLAPLASCVRTYTTSYGLDRVPELARKRGMSAVMGLSISRDQAANKAEIDRALSVINAQRPAIRALVVGNEVISRGDLTPAELAVIIRSVRQTARLPVTYADNAEIWLRSSDLVGIVEQITVNFSPYSAPRPVAAGQVAGSMREMRAKFSALFPGKEIVFAETGWPGEGRMRGAANPSPRNQAMAVHEMLAAGKAGNFRVHLYEAFDQPWRMAREGTAGANFGLLDGDTREPKFRFGAELSNHPHWFFQIVIGVMCALVAFAAGYLGARVAGPVNLKQTNGLPVAVVALVSGVMIGEVLVDMAAQNQTLLDWAHSGFLAFLALTVPPVCACALIRRAPRETFTALLDPLARSLADPLSRIVTFFQILVTLAAIELALGLVFDPANRDFQYAAMTAPVLSLLIVALINPHGQRRESTAETAAAILLAAAALYIFFSEGPWNWQALWFEALLLALAWTLVSARAARRTG
jgi:exo-beta-1,3-glucanase (GH17 family)